jgi:CRISPR-associated protein Csb2
LVRPERGDAARFDRVASSLDFVRAGELGVVRLPVNEPEFEEKKLVGPAQVWESHTDYRSTRRARRQARTAELLQRDVVAECQRRGFPTPEVHILECEAGSGGYASGRLRLRFAVAVSGPIILGGDSHQGGGLFLAS